MPTPSLNGGYTYSSCPLDLVCPYAEDRLSHFLLKGSSSSQRLLSFYKLPLLRLLFRGMLSSVERRKFWPLRSTVHEKIWRVALVSIGSRDALAVGESDQRLILAIDSHQPQVEVVREMLTTGDSRYRLEVMDQGQLALAFLHRRDIYEQAPRPDLILLDLDLPDCNGQEMLSQIKTDPQLRRIPLIVFTHSTAATDIRWSYSQQGNCYVVKPGDWEGFKATVRQIEAFWLEIVTLPPQ